MDEAGGRLSLRAAVLTIVAIFAVALAGCMPASTVVNLRDDFPMDEGMVAVDTPDHPFPDAQSVRLFVTSGYDKVRHKPIYLEPNGRLLTPAQRAEFEATLYTRKIYRYPELYGQAACCVPNHFARYYDARGKEIGSVAICFCCSCRRDMEVGAKPRPRIDDDVEQRFRYFAAARFVRSLGLPAEASCGEHIPGSLSDPRGFPTGTRPTS